MDIILKKTVETLGQEGEIVKVKPGYARNYLLPHNLAVLADKGNRAILKQQMAAIEARRAKAQEDAASLDKKLSGITIIIQQRVGQEDKLFGSVNAADISEKLKDLGFDIDRRKILLDEPIKTAGEKKVAIKTGFQQTTQIIISIQPLSEE
jgi:large subunit ribosomal protein L9